MSGAWRLALGAAIVAVLLISGLRGALLETGVPGPVEFLLGLLTGAGVLAVAWIAFGILVRGLRGVPGAGVPLILALLATLIVFDQWSMAELWRLAHTPSDWGSPLPPQHGLTVPALATVVLACGLLAALAARLRQAPETLARTTGGRALSASALAATIGAGVVVYALVDDGRDPHVTGFRTIGPGIDAGVPAVAAPDPASPGPFEVERLSYGAGENPRRPEFGAERDLEARTVDATGLLPEWKGLRGRVREEHWGFGLDAAPLNALVWAPVGEGPFPLVLIVHGNHSMVDVSDPGYAYLGDLLASRGFIVASVDENYVNGSWSGDFRGREMAIRAWLLLEHLSLWRDWDGTPGHRFEGRVDLDRIALIGHSRGGEAVSIAHAFDSLAHHPDDATIAFDYGFDIDALVAIAQVDQRYHRRVELDDVSFLALQGSYDADEPAFHGLRQFNRIDLSPDSGHFKAGLYVHGANHGQFNEGWGRRDYGPPGAWLLNLAPIIDGDVQRRIAAVSIAAFLEATLHDDGRYRRLFRDPRSGSAWLPEGIYAHQYQDATYVPIADFEDDLDVTSGSLAGIRLRTEGLALWREEALRHRDGRLQGSSAAVLGWHAGAAPRFEIALPAGLPEAAVEGEAVLTLAIAPSPERAPAGDGDEGGADEGSADEGSADEGSADDGDCADDAADTDAGFDFEVEFVDLEGAVRPVANPHFARVAPPLRVQYLKSAALNRERYDELWEAVLQTVEVPLPGIAPEAVRAVRLRFDGSCAGTAILDRIGVQTAATGHGGRGAQVENASGTAAP